MLRVRNVTQILTLLFALGVVAITGAAQQTKHPGIELYNQGKIDAAISSLDAASRQKAFSNNADIWNTLGLAYFAKSDFKRARKAFETAIGLEPEIAAFHGNLAFTCLLTGKMQDSRKQADAAIRLNPKDTNARFILGRVELSQDKFEEADSYASKIIELGPGLPDGYMLRADVLLARLGKLVGSGWDVRDEIDLLKQATDVLKTGAERAKNHPNHKTIDDQAEAVGAFYAHYSKEPQPAAAGTTPNVKPLAITHKPPPKYTDQARASGISGRVRIAVLFGADGQVHYTLILQGLGSGLDEMAIDAARHIQFLPQTVDGKPVSVVRTIEYNFSIY
jgi:TonB family protein